MAASEMTLPPLAARLRDLVRRLGLPAFWAWWTREIGAIVPAAPRAALARRRMRPVFVFEGDHATLWRPGMEEGRAAMSPAATIPLTGDAAAVAAAGRAALASLAEGAYAGAAATQQVVVSLPVHEYLRKRIVLPSAVEENFRQALAYDLDRHTPFKSDELYFDAAIVDRHPGRGTITVDLATVRRTIVDLAMRHAAAWGAEVAAVVPEPPANAANSRLNLLPADARSSRRAWRRWQFWVPVGVLAAMVVAAVAIPLWQKRDYVIQLSALADQARARAAVSETLRTELNTRVADYNYALERKYAYPGALQVVDTMSKLMPDDTWLTQFELKSVAKGHDTQREFLIRGETANAGRLVQLFEEAQLFAQPGQRGPTTKIQPGPGEIFDLGAQLKPQALPVPLALVVADKSGDPAAALPPAGIAAPAASMNPPPAGKAPPSPANPAAPVPASAALPGISAPPPMAAPATPGQDAGKAPVDAMGRKP